MAKQSKAVDAKELMTQAEAAAERGVSLAAINELVRRGRLRPIKMFGRTLLRRADVMSFERLKTGPKAGITTKSTKRKRATKR